ncbi:MAG: glutathione S-transferase [Parvibaculaceae bacterium]|nr:glutathione S-transferase [Parvibaculaceae bacterium]
MAPIAPLYKMHGLSHSYFTGKLQAYFQAKGLPYELVEMDVGAFRRCAKATGVAQMPQVETPEGAWLTDTTPTIAHLEATVSGPSFTPTTPAANFISLLLEDLFDEWFWRPALYYRWALAPDMHLMSRVFADTMMRDLPLPSFLRKQFMLRRQRRVYLGGDGITATTKEQVEALYLESLDMLETIFNKRPYLMGDRPCQADFGLFGPFFRHYSADPTPLAIMRERAPKTYEWVGRLWALRPDALDGAAPITEIPADLAPLLLMASRDYLPYLQANALAFETKARMVNYQTQGVDWSVPLAPYRVYCLNQLRQNYQALAADDQTAIEALLGGDGAKILRASLVTMETTSNTRDRLWNR